ncbi:hypothetical protein RSAG8_01389, partial [Rhizoctonia solani AG-8 WAC10335]
MFESSPRAIISQSLGWLYFIAWTVSFYPQVFLNARRKSVEGLSIDFVSLNVVGFTSYTIYTTNFFFNEEVREEYRKRHNGYDNSVQLNDVAFAIHVSYLQHVLTLSCQNSGYCVDASYFISNILLPPRSWAKIINL